MDPFFRFFVRPERPFLRPYLVCRAAPGADGVKAGRVQRPPEGHGLDAGEHGARMILDGAFSQLAWLGRPPPFRSGHALSHGKPRDGAASPKGWASPPIRVTVVAANPAALSLRLPGPRFCPELLGERSMMGSGEVRSSKLAARVRCEHCHRGRNGLTFPTSSAEQQLRQDDLCAGRQRRMPKSEVHPFDPHPMHDDGELAGHGHAGLPHTNSLSELDAPCSENGPFLGDP